MKKFILWSLAVIITISAAVYQRKTGPTNPKQVDVVLNNTAYKLKLVRSLSLNERSEVKLKVNDTTIKATLYYKRYNTNDEYKAVKFTYKVYPVNSLMMNKVFKISEENGFFAEVPQQPEAGKIQYYFEITDTKKTWTFFKDSPVIIRFKGNVPAIVLVPHILVMFLAMLFSTAAGLMSVTKYPSYKKYSIWTLILFFTGGMILGPIVQYYAFSEFWTGVPFGWDLTDNKALISLLFWIVAVVMNRKKEKPIYTLVAAVILLLVYSIPHSLFGSELNYSSGQVTQGNILGFF